MTMPDFIIDNLEGILQDWEEFAATLHPGAVGMSRSELRDLAESILRRAADEMSTEQTEAERKQRSLGRRSPEQRVDESARGHAVERLAAGFTLNQLVAEYRALRASVIRRWRAEVGPVTEADLEELTRFNEAIDESLVESIGWYHARIEDARDLLNGVLAHDLRSPLGAILTSAEVLLLDDTLSAQQVQTAMRMRNSANRMRSMISDLLDYTRTRLGTGLPMAIEECNMGIVVRDVLEEQRAAHPLVTLDEEASGNLIGRWDRQRIEQMLANLISNAVEHGGRSPVTVTARGESDRVTLEIHNERGSIPQAQQRLIFDPLRSAAVQDRQAGPTGAGLGLGLYIARQIAEAHDGTIDVTSAEDQGTTFTVRLPRERKPGAETAGLT